MKKYSTILYDIMFYAALPYFVWNFGRDPLGDYYAMLLSSVPGILYTMIRFFLTKQFNFTGIYIISNLLISSMISLLSGSAENMQWNRVYVSFATGTMYLVTIIIKKPLFMYFAADFAALQGAARKESFLLFHEKHIFRSFQLLTLLNVISAYVSGTLRGYLLLEYGVERYDLILIAMQINRWIFSGIGLIASLLILRQIYSTIAEKKIKKKEEKTISAAAITEVNRFEK